jgi:hypothetical protein
MTGRLQSELGDRVARALVMENIGSRRRREWWIVSEYVLAECADHEHADAA